MPGDVQLTALQQSAAPLDYDVPPSALVRVKSIRAEFTDNGAAGTWLPAVQLISDSGHIVATASDQNASVAAGGSADASFFPGVKPAAAAVAASGGVPWAQTNQHGVAQTINSGVGSVYFSVQDGVASGKFETSDATIFDNASTTLFTGSPVFGIRVKAAGTYMVQGAFFWTSQGTTGRGISAYYSQSNGSGPSIFQAGRTDSLTGDNWSHAAAAPGLPHLSFYEFFSVSAAQLNGVNALWASVQSGGASTVSAAMMIFQLSTYVATKL